MRHCHQHLLRNWRRQCVRGLTQCGATTGIVMDVPPKLEAKIQMLHWNCPGTLSWNPDRENASDDEVKRSIWRRDHLSDFFLDLELLDLFFLISAWSPQGASKRMVLNAVLTHKEATWGCRAEALDGRVDLWGCTCWAFGEVCSLS